MFQLNLYARLGATPNAPFDPAHKYVTSPIIRSPITFAALRLVVALYTLSTLLATLIQKAVVTHDADSYFSYFTYLTYIGVCAYYFAAGTQTAAYMYRWRRLGAGAGYPLQRWNRTLQVLHVVLQATVTTFPFVVTIVFWALLAEPSTFANVFSAWSNISVHALNTVFALVELLASNSPPAPWVALPITLILLASYLGVAYITHATQGIYTYSFLDPKKQGAKLAIYIVGIAVAQIIIFCVVRGIAVLRQRWAARTARVLPSTSPAAMASEDIEGGWEEVERPSTIKA